jgi:hypothetical protein
MPHRLALAAVATPALAWALLGLAAASQRSASCTTNDPAAEGALILGILGAVAALAGVTVNVWPFAAIRDLGVLAAGIVAAGLGFLAIGFGVVGVVGALALYGVVRIAASSADRAVRGRALAAYLASSLWFPVAGIALLWAALRCFTF